MKRGAPPTIFPSPKMIGGAAQFIRGVPRFIWGAPLAAGGAPLFKSDAPHFIGGAPQIVLAAPLIIGGAAFFAKKPGFSAKTAIFTLFHHENAPWDVGGWLYGDYFSPAADDRWPSAKISSPALPNPSPFSWPAHKMSRKKTFQPSICRSGGYERLRTAYLCPSSGYIPRPAGYGCHRSG